MSLGEKLKLGPFSREETQIHSNNMDLFGREEHHSLTGQEMNETDLETRNEAKEKNRISGCLGFCRAYMEKQEVLNTFTS